MYEEYYSSVGGISADAGVLAGATTITDNNVGFYWTEDDGMVATTTTCTSCEYEVYGISADGRTVVGGVPDGSWGPRALYGIIEEDGSVTLHEIGLSQDLLRLVDASGDGSIMVGTDPFAAIYFAGDSDPLVLQDYLEQYLGEALDGWELGTVTGISDDGLTFVGYGSNPVGATEGWIAHVPEPSTALLLAFGLAGLAAAGRRSMGAEASAPCSVSDRRIEQQLETCGMPVHYVGLLPLRNPQYLRPDP